MFGSTYLFFIIQQPKDKMLNDYLYKEDSPVELIGGLIPKHKTTLLHGRSGCGKTLGIIKFLNEQKEDIYFIDFDDNSIYSNLVALHIDGHKLIEGIKENGYKAVKELKNKTIIMDTYALLQLALSGEDTIEFIQNIESLFNPTLIIIAHTTMFAGKANVPDVDNIFANHVACRLQLFKNVLAKRVDIYLEVEKLRGYKGLSKIDNWMR